MLKPYELLENILNEIEKGIREDINTDVLANQFSLSSGHLKRLFKFAFNKPIGKYIRSRKLASSLDDLLYTDKNILDIALNYDYEYEQSYILAFKREFGITPGDLRKNRHIIKITPPLNLFNENKLPEDSLIFGPDIVMVPQFHVIGKNHQIPFEDSISLAPKAAKDFWENDRPKIKNIKNPDIYIGLTHNINLEDKSSQYITSMLVDDTNNVPYGYYQYTFENTLCARFRYIGKHHYYDIDREIAGVMYSTINKFSNDVQAKYSLLNNKTYFEKIDTGIYDGVYCQMEWFAPVVKK